MPTTHELRPRVLVTFNPERLAAQVVRRRAGSREIRPLWTRPRQPACRCCVTWWRIGVFVPGCRPGTCSRENCMSPSSTCRTRRKPKVDWSRDPLELPVDSSGLASIEAKLDNILTKIDNMPLEKMGADVNNAIAALNQTLKQTDALLGRIDARMGARGNQDHARPCTGDRRCRSITAQPGRAGCRRICTTRCRNSPVPRAPCASSSIICNGTPRY